MEDESNTLQNVPTEALAEQGAKSGKQQLEDKKKDYFSQMGKRSAAKRAKDKRFNNKYYKKLSDRAVAAKKAKKEGKTLPPFEPPQSHISKISSFLKGEL